MTHAFFKALLFLGSGSVIHGMHHEQDMRRMGNLRKYMPVTFITMGMGWLAHLRHPDHGRAFLEGRPIATFAPPRAYAADGKPAFPIVMTMTRACVYLRRLAHSPAVSCRDLHSRG